MLITKKCSNYTNTKNRKKINQQINSLTVNIIIELLRTITVVAYKLLNCYVSNIINYVHVQIY